MARNFLVGAVAALALSPLLPLVPIPSPLDALFGATAALGQPVDQQKATAAQALFDQAGDEMEAKNFAAACPRLEEAVKLIPEALGARATLAECYEGLGKLASAWTQYTMVEGLATKSGERARAEEAGNKAAALKPKLATLTIEIASGVDALPGLAITRDGASVGTGQAGVGLPVDVGRHEIVVSATGYKTWKKTIEVIADGAKATAKIPMLEREATATSPVASTGERKWQTPLAIGLMVGGGVGLGLGGIFGGLAIAKNAESNEKECDASTDICSPAGIDMRSDARTFGNVSTAMFVVGGVLAAGGIVLMVIPRGGSGSGADNKKIGSLAIAPAPGGLHVLGTW